jgi:mannitol 2-dehydrogenase
MVLNQSNLPIIANKISCPTYDRAGLKTGIVHIGVGGFHRSHQAYYIHQLLEKYNALDWGICGVGLRDADRKMGEVLKKQDGLYTLVTQYPDTTENSNVIGSIHEFLLAVDTPDLVIDKMAHPDTKIVSLTITEGGYNFDTHTGDFDFENADIQFELSHPNEPKSVYGFLTKALKQRKSQGVAPFTILSCDNIQHNGDVVRKMLLSFVQRQDPELANWIATAVSFPNTMVDRITPATTSEVTDYLRNTYDLVDDWCVVCEPFIQWIVEDNFSNGRPQLEQVGVQFVSDVSPYENMKIRLLNAGHSVLGIPGAIHGHPTIDACMKDTVFAKFMRQFMNLEATAVLTEVEGIDFEKYKDQLEERFANPNIKDSVSRICSESAAKLPKFLIPTLRENLERKGSIRFATFILASWCYYCDKKYDEKGQPLDIIDAKKSELFNAAQNTENEWDSFLHQPAIFGDLVENERFKTEYLRTVQSIYATHDIRKLMNEFMATEIN